MLGSVSQGIVKTASAGTEIEGTHMRLESRMIIWKKYRISDTDYRYDLLEKTYHHPKILWKDIPDTCLFIYLFESENISSFIKINKLCFYISI